jgi:hypothetical protein
MLMLGILVIIMLPAIHAGTLAGAPVRGIIFPAGVAVIIGAFIFGLGMQLGGGCASGTLYTSGGGNTRMLLTLMFFIIGATIAAYDSERWAELPALSATSLPELIGLWPTIIGSPVLNRSSVRHQQHHRGAGPGPSPRLSSPFSTSSRFGQRGGPG